MADQVSTGSDQSVGTLVKGIVHDVENLTRQQLKLFRTEISQDMQKAKEGAAFLSGGALALLVGAILLGIMLAELLDMAGLPDWASYGIVGILAACIGGALCLAGQKKFERAVPPAERSLEALEENVECLTHPK